MYRSAEFGKGREQNRSVAKSSGIEWKRLAEKSYRIVPIGKVKQGNGTALRRNETKRNAAEWSGVEEHGNARE